MTGYPKGFYELLLATLAALALSGLLLIPTVLELQLAWEVPWRPSYEQRVVVAVVHVAASFAIFAFIGALWAVHMRRGWRMGRNRISGTTLTSLMGLLLVSGIGIYYFGGELSSSIASLSHTGLGLIAIGGFAVHFLRCQTSKANA